LGEAPLLEPVLDVGAVHDDVEELGDVRLEHERRHARAKNGHVEIDGLAPDDYELRAPWAKPKPKMTLQATLNSARLAGMPFHEQILAAARAHGVDSALVHAVIAAESNYNTKAVSPKGAIGLMQVMPETGARYGVLRAGLAKPDANIGTGTRYLAELLEMFEGNLELALAGYNAGENAVIRYGMRIPPFAETRAYVARVKRIYAELRAR